MIKHILIIAVIVIPWLPYPVGHAGETDWLLCGPPALQPDIPQKSLPPDSPVEMTADVAEFDQDKGQATLIGNVEIFRGRQYLRAESVQYSEQEAKIKAEDSVVFNEKGLTVRGPKAEMNLDDDTAEFIEPSYVFSPKHARGKSSRAYRKSPDVLELELANYTTCNPGETDWLISADKVTLDQESGDGTARNVVLRFQNIPIMYSPWFRFPIDDRRKSGFLIPGVGTTSKSGFQVSVPYYWNMAPNRDAIITPRFLSERGLQVLTQFRYLYPFSSSVGLMNLEYINDSKTNSNRYFFSFKDSSRWFRRVSTRIDFRQASDKDYFEDFGNSLSETSVTHLLQNFDAIYSGGSWNFMTRLQKYQTVDKDIEPINRPYERIPQLLLWGHLREQAFGLGYKFRSELVRFERDADAGITGDRFDLRLDLERPFVHPGAYFEPKVGLRFTAYDLNNTGGTIEKRPTRSLPVVSVDTGLIFERPLADGQTLQTLEPQLFYLYVPFESQENIPIFDTTELDFNYSALFRDNRFAGSDRIGDANQLSLAMTSRLIDSANGYETLRLSLGQIMYFRDREVTLPDEPPDNDNTSDFFGALFARVGKHWSARGLAILDPHQENVTRSAARLQYVGDNNRVVNMTYSFRRDELEQTDFAFAWPVVRRNWHLLGRWNYDLKESRTLEVLGGLEYDTCCWTGRVLMRRYINNADGDFNNAFEAQLVFKGLTKIGSSIEKTLERGILGYEAD